jgi:hypothetical protein
LYSNSFEYKTTKFLKNRQSLIFQKLARGGFASAIPDLLSAESRLVSQGAYGVNSPFVAA